MKTKGTIILIASVLMIAYIQCATGNTTEKKEDKGKRVTEHQLQKFIKAPRFLPGEVLFYCDFYEGYDDNVNLDSTRKGDTYTELALEVGYKQPFKGDFDATLDYYLSAINYRDITDGTFYDNNLSIELEKEIFDALFNLGLRSNLEYDYYPKDDGSTFYAIEPEIFLRHNFNENIYQKMIFNFMYKEYADRKARNGAGDYEDAERKDRRNKLAHELRAIIFEKYVLKIKNQYYLNDSNDQYMDYYDYSSYRADATLIMPLLFERLYGLISCGYQLRDYQDRELVNDISKTQEDDFYSIISSLIYDLNDAFSISFNYSYIQNESNEPSEEYSGSTISLGLHYAF